MTAIVTLHDVSPRTLAACQRLRDALEAARVARVTLLVIPDHHGGHPLWRHAATVRWLRARLAAGDELAQHGHLHLAGRPPPGRLARLTAALLTRGEGECLGQSWAERAEMLGPVRRRLEDAVGARLAGFVPPAWLAPTGLERALIAAGFTWLERRHELRALPHGRRRRAPVLTFAGGARARIAASRAYVGALAPLARRAALVRLALHPCDDAEPAVRTQALALAARVAAAHAVVTTAAALGAAAPGAAPARG